MSLALPPRPDFTQLKHQAKDLLHAHEKKDASACGVLRRLRQFASADDAEAFGASALGLTKDDYYRRLCELADRLGGGAGPIGSVPGA